MSMPERFDSEEKFIINERPEVSVGEDQRWVKRLSGTFPALKNKNYKLYFYGQLVSLIGTWLQIVAQGWLVLQLTNSAFLIGLVAALATLPTLLFTLFGGVVVDRFPKKHILLFTQSGAMVLAFILGILTSLDLINIWEICVISFLLGMLNALDAPARQAFVSELVNRDQLASAIALNSGAFNAARVIGPSMAGILIALIETGGAFIMNGISYIAVIIALFAMKIDLYVPEKKIHPIKAIKEGLTYSFSHPIIRTLIVFAGVTSVFGWSYTTVIPIIAKNEFHLGAAGLGYLFAASGSGALLATILISAFSKKISGMVFILGGNSIFALSLILFSFTTNFYLALLLLFLSGFGLISQASMMNSTIQGMVKSELRGRVMSIYILMFIGLIPLGNIEIGYLSEKIGTSLAIRTGAIIVFLFGGIIFIYRNKIRTAYEEYKKQDISN
jgi:MFS family permease